MKTAKNILDSKGRDVHTVRPDDTVLTALGLMAEHNVGALVVVENEELVGIISERDYARKVILKGKFSKDTPVSEIMEKRGHCISSTQIVDACMALMTEHRIRHLPVLEMGRLAGLVSVRDVVKAIIEDQKFTIEQLEHYIAGTP